MFDGIEIFFNALKDKCSSAEEYAAELLKARGFLLEDDGLVLSDNSHKDDAAYLNALLTADDLGEVRDGKIFIAPNANVEKIFYSKLINGCEAWLGMEITWERFVHDSCAPKVPLSYLEPFVGRYVKAISACGVATWCSCDGNHPNAQRILIDFSGEPHKVWHEVICRRCLTGRFNLKWRRGCSAIEFNASNKWQTYVEFNRAAEFLYNNRLTIRQIRREASDAVGLRNARTLPSDELAKIFSERADELFDKTTLQY